MMHQSARDLRPRIPDPTPLLAFLLPIFAWAPLTYPGYLAFLSGYLPVFNLADRLAHFGDLAWMPVVGREYGLLAGEGPLPYLLAAIPAAIGLSPGTAVKIIFGLSFVAASAGTYFWSRRRLQDGWPALAAAALYIWNPIFLSAVYTRGAFAEAVLLGLAPWLLWAADAALGGRRSAPVVLALLAAAAMWTQLALALAFLGVVLVYLLVIRSTEHLPLRLLSWPGLALGAGLILGALGLLPVALRHGLGAPDWPQPAWTILLVPWIALLAGWIAARLAAMLPPEEARDRGALFAALIGLALLAVYPGLQPAATAGTIPRAPLAIFGQNEIALLSVQPEGTPRPGGRVAVDVTWQALRPIERDYTVFFHVIAGNDQRYGQLDTMPLGGKLPTSQWQPGQIVRDRYEAAISPDAPAAADYRYWLGWYFNPTGERLRAGPGSAGARDDKYTVNP